MQVEGLSKFIIRIKCRHDRMCCVCKPVPANLGPRLGYMLGCAGLTHYILVQVSDEAERSLLVKLKTECGYQFTSKLESMFTDIKTSRDTMQDYKSIRRAAATSAASSADDTDIDLFVQARLYPGALHGTFSTLVM